MADAPPDPTTLCQDLAELHRALSDAIIPTAAPPGRSSPDGAGHGLRCAAHGDQLPYGPLPRGCRRAAPTYLGAALTGTGHGDGTSRRGIPGSKPPTSGDGSQALEVQEAIDRAAVQLANGIRMTLGHSLRSRRGIHALETLPALLDALPECDSGDMLIRHARMILGTLRQQAKDALGLSRRILWLGECPTTFPEQPVDVMTRAGLVKGSVECWTLDIGAMVDSDGTVEIWKRSRLALPRDEVSPDVQCWACRGRWDPVEMAGLVAAHLRERAAG